MHAFKYIAGALQRRCLKSWKSWLEVKNPTSLCRQCTGVQLKWNWIHQMLSMLDIGVDSVSSLALLIIVVEYFVHAIQWKYFFSDANNACQVENGPQPQRGGRSPRKAFGSMGLPWVPRQDCPGAKDVKNANIWGLWYLIKQAQVKSQMDGPGLLLDFHGQTHAGNRTELGYAVSSERYSHTDVECWSFMFSLSRDKLWFQGQTSTRAGRIQRICREAALMPWPWGQEVDMRLLDQIYLDLKSTTSTGGHEAQISLD